MILEQNKCRTGEDLLRPPVETVGVGTDVVQSHLGLGLLGVRLEEDCLVVATPGTRVVLRPGHGRVLGRYQHQRLLRYV